MKHNSHRNQAAFCWSSWRIHETKLELAAKSVWWNVLPSGVDPIEMIGYLWENLLNNNRTLRLDDWYHQETMQKIMILASRLQTVQEFPSMNPRALCVIKGGIHTYCSLVCYLSLQGALQVLDQPPCSKTYFPIGSWALCLLDECKVTHTNAGLFQPMVGANMDKPNQTIGLKF